MVFEKIREIIATQFDIPEENVTMETTVADDLGADSLDIVEVLMSIEDEFDVEIPDEAIEEIKSVGDLVNYIEAHQ